MRFGIVGTGVIAKRMAKVLLAMKDAELYGVASRTPARAEAFAGEFGIPRFYGSYGEMAQDPQVEAVYIATPHTEHFACAKLMLTHHKPTLCEKPVTVCADQMKELAALSKETGTFFMEAMWTRCLPSTLKVLELIKSGVIGDLLTVKATFSFLCPYDPNHRLWKKAVGGGALLDVGIYPVSYIATLFGTKPAQIEAVATMNQDGIDTKTAALLRSPGGKIGVADCGIDVTMDSDGFLYGTKGKMVLERFYKCEKIRLYVNGQAPEIIEMPFLIDGFEYEVEEMMRCIKAGLTESILVSHAYSVEVMELMDEIRKKIGLEYA